MTLRKAEITYKDVPAGTLEETANGGTRFTYGKGFDTSIACTLPIRQREHEWKQGVHPFFQHLGPEGWLREKQARTAHVQEQDDFGLLLRYGADCIGAVGARRFADDVGKDVEITELTANPNRTISGVNASSSSSKTATPSPLPSGMAQRHTSQSSIPKPRRCAPSCGTRA
jgi:serine/threonine-protein kinase HipA